MIGAGSRLDNQVQIAHNVVIGRCCAFAAQVGVSGLTVFEDFVSVGGQAGFSGHQRVGQGAQIAAKAAVMTDIAPGADGANPSSAQTRIFPAIGDPQAVGTATEVAALRTSPLQLAAQGRFGEAG